MSSAEVYAVYRNAFRLCWYRDQGNGQEASDATGAVETMDGSWPVATLECNGQQDAAVKWADLFKDYAVNAMTYYPVNYDTHSK